MDKKLKKRIKNEITEQKEEVVLKNSVIVPIKPKDDTQIKGGIMIDGKKHLYEPDEEFESCCFKCDKPLCLYIGKYTISLLVLVFCFFMLQSKDNSAEFYTGTIAGLLGHYLNSPISQTTAQKRKEKED